MKKAHLQMICPVGGEFFLSIKKEQFYIVLRITACSLLSSEQLEER